jgi:NADH dehydrogenase
LVEACEGADVVISSASAMKTQNPQDTFGAVDLDGQLALVSAAERAGCKRFVFVSSPPLQQESPLGSAKREVEKRLEAGRMPFTILRPGLFADVWLTPFLGFDYVEGRVRIYGEGRNAITWLGVADMARVAAWAAYGEPPPRTTLEFGGPQALSPLDVVAIFERLSGRPFAREFVPEAALEAQHGSALDPRQRTFFAIACQYARGFKVDATTLPNGAPRPTTTVEEYARRVLKKQINAHPRNGDENGR